MRTGSLRAVAVDMMPPFDCTMWSWPGKLLRLERGFELADVGGDDRLQIGVDAPSVEERSNSRISDSTSCEAVTKSLGQTSRTAAMARALVVGVGIGVDEDDRDCSAAPLLQEMLRGRADLGRIDRGADAAVGQRALVDLDAHVAVGDRE